MKIAALFLWMIVPLSLWWGYATYGTPHVVATYRYAGSTYLPPSERRYIDCDYYGLKGKVTVSALGGRCPLVRFFKPGSDQ